LSAADRLLVYELRMPIRWGDMDAMGHVNNTVYFRYMEQCRISWFDRMGFSPDPTGQGPVIVNANCDFIQQLKYPGDVLCRHYVGDIGRSSFQTHVDMSRADDPDRISASGGARVVWVDFPKGKSVPLPAEVRESITRRWTGLI
jgi:acyl-CoA thioester hydrolase